VSERHSTAKTSTSKPAKPYPEYPLTAHPAGYWCKKIRGKIHYFGRWHDPDAALKEYERQADALHTGRKPREITTGGCTVKQLCNKFLNAKHALSEAGELSPRTLADYKACCGVLVSRFGAGRLVADLDTSDFADLRNHMAKSWGPHMVGKYIQITRCVCKYGFDAGLLEPPVRYGPGFKRPSKKTMRLHRAKKGAKLFSAQEVRRMIDAAGVQLKAMVLLGINAGFGNADCAGLPIEALELDSGWLAFLRPKTGIDRRCALWPETVAALHEVLAHRKEPKDAADAGLVFITKYGDGWGKDIADSPITKELRKLLDKLEINGGRNFYALRHTFRTVADGAKDQLAADHIMGHEVAHMSSVYRERIDDGRLRAVADHVRAWLFAV
jgi:integrase